MNASIPETQELAPFDAEERDLSRDRFPIRSLRPDDLPAICRIDRKLTGRDRRDYYEAKLKEVMSETGVRVSLVAEVDGRPAGYIMARVDYGEFGRAEPAAVLDTIGVDPGLTHQGIASALLSQLMVNLKGLHVERVRTAVRADDIALLGFMTKAGFAPAQQLVLSKRIA